MTHHAAQSRTGLRTVHNLLNRCVEQPAVEESRIMATCAPFGGLHSHNVLHVFDALSIPLIVEGGKMVHGAKPLPVDIGVTSLTRVRFHEIAARNSSLVCRLRRTRKEQPMRTITLSVHGDWSRGR